MENQHKFIKGYRELSLEEIALMNEIKAKGQELLDLQMRLHNHLGTQFEVKREAAEQSIDRKQFPYMSPLAGATNECREFARFELAEPLTWSNLAKIDIQRGIMALVRAIAQPATC